MSRIVSGLSGLGPNQVWRRGATRSAESVRGGMEAVSVVATVSMGGPNPSPTLLEDETVGDEGAPGVAAVLEEDEEEVAGSVGVSESEGLPGWLGRLEEKTSGRGAMEASGCWTTNRLGWRNPMGWGAKSAVAMPVAVACGAAGSSGWATRAWRRPQK